MAALRPPPFVSALGRGCIVTGIPFRISFPGSQQDGWADLFVTNVDREMHSLYHNNQDETFDTEVKYYEPMLLFRGNRKRFEDVSASRGPGVFPALRLARHGSGRLQ